MAITLDQFLQLEVGDSVELMTNSFESEGFPKGKYRVSDLLVIEPNYATLWVLSFNHELIPEIQYGLQRGEYLPLICVGYPKRSLHADKFKLSSH